MAAPHQVFSFAVEDAKVYKLTADPIGGTPTYDTGVDLPGIRQVGMDLTFDTKTAIGDNRVMFQATTLTGLTLSVEHMQISFDVLAILMGGSVTDSGTGTSEVATYKRKGGDDFSFFKFEAKTPANGAGGDLHLVVHKLLFSGGSPIGLSNQDFFVPSFTAVGSAISGTTDDMYWMVGNETETAIAA